jgi:hypothetical protein
VPTLSTLLLNFQYRLFRIRNAHSVSRTLRVESHGVMLTTTVTVAGRAVGGPLPCPSDAQRELSTTMQLTLACSDERIPYESTYRVAIQDWIGAEGVAAPWSFVRVRSIHGSLTPTRPGAPAPN